ncbi:MAG: hypothetical protein AAGN82_27270 [Myxococcota bacterium]
MRFAPLPLALVGPLLAGCAGGEAASADDAAPEWTAVETGRDCARSEVNCGPGECAAAIDNQCATPVTCELFIECICRTPTGEEGPASATSNQTTILSGNREPVEAKVICDRGDVYATIARRVTCF